MRVTRNRTVKNRARCGSEIWRLRVYEGRFVVQRCQNLPTPWRGLLLNKEKDLILIVKTSFGKSMILQAVPVLLFQSITLAILPLRQIGEEQTNYIKGLVANPASWIRIQSTPVSLARYAKEIIHTYSSALSLSAAVLRNPQFQARLSLVVIDEAHLVSQWGGLPTLDWINCAVYLET